MKYNYFYVPYREIKKVDYITLFWLYSIAFVESPIEKGEVFYINNKIPNIKSCICFTSYQDLANKLNAKIQEEGMKTKPFTESKIKRFLNNAIYKDFFMFIYNNKNDYELLLRNNLKGFTDNERLIPPFVRLSPKIIHLILEQDDNLLAEYIIYLVYSCGIHNNSTDFTANQFLSTFGRSINSGAYKTSLYQFNAFLKEKQIISIKSYQEHGNKWRNIYSLLDP